MVKRVKGNLEPFRVTEPFYWLLAQWSCIPYRYREVWMDKKGKERAGGVLLLRVGTERDGQPETSGDPGQQEDQRGQVAVH